MLDNLYYTYSCFMILVAILFPGLVICTVFYSMFKFWHKIRTTRLYHKLYHKFIVKSLKA